MRRCSRRALTRWIVAAHELRAHDAGGRRAARSSSAGLGSPRSATTARGRGSAAPAPASHEPLHHLERRARRRARAGPGAQQRAVQRSPPSTAAAARCSRLVHPIWEPAEDGLVGWVTSRRRRCAAPTSPPRRSSRARPGIPATTSPSPSAPRAGSTTRPRRRTRGSASAPRRRRSGTTRRRSGPADPDGPDAAVIRLDPVAPEGRRRRAALAGGEPAVFGAAPRSGPGRACGGAAARAVRRAGPSRRRRGARSCRRA